MNSKPTLGSPEKPPRLGAGGLSPSSRSRAGRPARKQVRGPPGARAPPGPALGPRRPTGVDGLWAGALRGLCSAGVFSWSCFSAHSCHTGSDRSCDCRFSVVPSSLQPEVWTPQSAIRTPHPDPRGQAAWGHGGSSRQRPRGTGQILPRCRSAGVPGPAGLSLEGGDAGLGQQSQCFRA